jgi:ERCC4-type nuclease
MNSGSHFHRSSFHEEKLMQIMIDDREGPSGIAGLMKKANVPITVQRLKYGDYLVNGATCVERKTARDFILSIMDGRLFSQISRLKKASANPLLLIEGDPYTTDIDMNGNAVKGALISITAIWNVPVVFSSSPEDTKDILLLIGRQWENARSIPLRKRLKFRKKISKQLFFLQGLPNIGPERAERLLRSFGSVMKILNAGDDALLKVKGIGKTTVREIRAVLAEEKRFTHAQGETTC